MLATLLLGIALAGGAAWDVTLIQQRTAEQLATQGISLSDRELILELAHGPSGWLVVLRSTAPGKRASVQVVSELPDEQEAAVRAVVDAVKELLGSHTGEPVAPTGDTRLVRKQAIAQQIESPMLSAPNPALQEFLAPTLSTLGGGLVFSLGYNALYRDSERSVALFGAGMAVFALSGYVPLLFDEDDHRGDTYTALLSLAGAGGALAAVVHDTNPGPARTPLYIAAASVALTGVTNTVADHIAPPCNAVARYRAFKGVMGAPTETLPAAIGTLDECAVRNRENRSLLWLKLLPLITGAGANIALSIFGDDNAGRIAAASIGATLVLYPLSIAAIFLMLEQPDESYLDAVEQQGLPLEMSVGVGPGGLVLAATF